mmetsp:Transcript_17231/g.40082  ORF Transcript_17231/g.40082 Transcript_17231/m.40082 type:complete len:286 (+) Transcript_17231:260-1117(+)
MYPGRDHRSLFWRPYVGSRMRRGRLLALLDIGGLGHYATCSEDRCPNLSPAKSVVGSWKLATHMLQGRSVQEQQLNEGECSWHRWTDQRLGFQEYIPLAPHVTTSKNTPADSQHATAHNNDGLLLQHLLSGPIESRLQVPDEVKHGVLLQITCPRDMFQDVLVHDIVVSHLTLQSLRDICLQELRMRLHPAHIRCMVEILTEPSANLPRQPSLIHQHTQLVHLLLLIRFMRIYGGDERHNLCNDVRPNIADDDHRHRCNNILRSVLRCDIPIANSRQCHSCPIQR